MKIALLGAPESGKSKFARKLANAMAKRPVIIDGYVEKLEKLTGYELDFQAAYPQDLQIILNRWTLEQAATHKGDDTITCGTIYETAIYVAIRSMIAEQTANFDQIDDALHFRCTMTAIGMLEQLTYNYEAMFYLPYSAKKLLAKGKSYDTLIDKKIPEILEGYQKNFVVLDGTERENVKYSADLVRAIVTAKETADDDEPAIRGSGEDPIPLTEDSKRMSDVRI